MISREFKVVCEKGGKLNQRWVVDVVSRILSRVGELVTVKEGEIITSRSLEDYEFSLGFRAEDLLNKYVLDVGAGGSDLGRELKERGINATVVSADLMRKEPTHGQWALFYGVTRLARLLIKAGLKDLGRRLNRLGGGDVMYKEGRMFVQSDAVKLPFENKRFDKVLSLYALYQISPEKRRDVLRELYRVSRETLIVGPISRGDIRVLVKLMNENEIIKIRPFFGSSNKFHRLLKQPLTNVIDRVMTLDGNSGLGSAFGLDMMILPVLGGKVVVGGFVVKIEKSEIED